MFIFTACNGKTSKININSTDKTSLAQVNSNKKTVPVNDTETSEKEKISKSSKTNTNSTMKSNTKSTDKTIAAKANSNNKVIVIDPGHGGTVTSQKEPVSPGSTIMKAENTVGACGVNPKLTEYELNLKVALKLEKLLENNGYKVILTRTSNSQTIGNIERAEIGNKNNADLVIRIHADSYSSTSVMGASMLVPGNCGYAKNIYQKSRKYGEIIFSELLKKAGMKSRGIFIRDDLTGFNWSKVPVVLIEMGFLSNPYEDKLLSTEAYQDKIAAGLCQGINKALS